MTRDPDWFTPHVDDYTAAYDGTGDLDAPCLCGMDECVECGGAPGLGEELAESDAAIRYATERGRPGLKYPEDD